MILSLLLIFSLASTLILYFVTDWYQSISDIWMFPVLFIVSFIVGIILVLLYIYILSLFVNKNKECNKPKKLYLRIVLRVCELILMVSRTRLYVRGIENLPTDQKFLLVTNHQSWFDAIVCAWTLRAHNVSFVLKDSLSKIFVLCKYLHACSYISINRSNPREGVKAINKSVDKIVNDEASIVIFPEGTRSGGYEIGEFHNGSFKIGTKAKCPIVVCCLQNSFKAPKRAPFKATDVYFDVIDIIGYEEYKEKTTQEISDYCHKLVKENADKLPKY